MRWLGAVLLMISMVPAVGSSATANEAGWAPPIHDDQLFWYLLLDQLEYRATEGPDAVDWDAEGWVGGDYNRLWLKTEGEQEPSGDGLGRIEVQGLYGRMISPYWDLQVGLRHDRFFGKGPDHVRTFVVLGAQGLAPYWFELEPALFVSEDGDVSFRLTGEYDLLITQRLVLQPKFELDAALQEVKKFGVGRGLNHLDLDLRLRYELRREFAPYLGICWNRALGATAGLAREEGEDVASFAVVVGVRLWF